MNNLTREEFAKFLAALDSDRNQAAKKYEVLHRKLVKLFERRQCVHPEEFADETIDRLVKRLGTAEIPDISLFAYGIARNICFEIQRKTHRLVSIQEHYWHEDLLVGDGDPEHNIIAVLGNAQNLGCLTKCLAALPLECHELIIEYYRGEKQERITQRKDLARKRGISIEALHTQANRVRDKLRICVTRCLRKRQQGSTQPEVKSVAAAR
jgi:DNA-directed RNA polymerase specialized sigma24 family protein